MKKIYSLLAIFLCIGLIAPVCAFPIEKTHMDSWGRTMMFDNGDAIYFGQTVAVTESSICYNYEYEVFENCTVTIKTDGHVVVIDENGDRIVSKNGFEFHYTSNWRFIGTGMTWNNFPSEGAQKLIQNVTAGTIAQKLVTFLDGRPYSELPETFTVGDVVFTHDATFGNDQDYHYYDADGRFVINVWGYQRACFYDGCIIGYWYMYNDVDWFDGEGSFEDFMTTLNANAEDIDIEVWAEGHIDDWDCYFVISQFATEQN